MNTVFCVFQGSCSEKIRVRMYFLHTGQFCFVSSSIFWNMVLNFYNIVELKHNVVNGFIHSLFKLKTDVWRVTYMHILWPLLSLLSFTKKNRESFLAMISNTRCKFSFSYLKVCIWWVSWTGLNDVIPAGHLRYRIDPMRLRLAVLHELNCLDNLVVLIVQYKQGETNHGVHNNPSLESLFI
jgi:hypothetical protein